MKGAVTSPNIMYISIAQKEQKSEVDLYQMDVH